MLAYNVSLLFFLFSKNKSAIPSWYTIQVGSVAAWNFCMIMLRSTESPVWMYVWVHLLYFFALLIPLSFSLFLLNNEQYTFSPKLKRAFKWFCVCLACNFIFLPFVFESVSKGAQEKVINFTNIGMFYNFSIGLAFGLGIFLLIMVSKNIDRQTIVYRQVKVMLWGSGLTALVGVVSSLLLPLFGNNHFGWVGHIASGIFTSSTIYAIARFNFLNIKITLSKFFKYLIYSVYSYIVFYGLTYIYVQAFGSVTAREPLLIGIIISPIFAYILFKLDHYTDILNSKLFNEINKHSDLVQHLSQYFATTLVEKDLLEHTKEVLNTFFETNSIYIDKKNVPKEDLHKFAYLDTLTRNDEVRLVLALAKRYDDVDYSKPDLEMVQTIGEQLLVALERADLYGKVSSFAQDLEKEVNKQTNEIRLQNNQLADLLKSKDEVLHIVNHQLNTPLSILKAAVGMVRDGLWTQDKFIDITMKEVERLEQIIKDFWIAEDSNNLGAALKKERVDFGELVSKIIDEKSALSKIVNKEVSLEIEKPTDNVISYLDKTQITQVVSNYIENAIAYTKSGKISVRYNIDKNLLIFSVKDSGIGFSEEVKGSLFSKFSRSQNARLVRPNGSGLGLYICKRIIEAHSGYVWARSEGEGKGSEFSFSIPLD